MSYVSKVAFQTLTDAIYDQGLPQVVRDYIAQQMATPSAEETAYRQALATARNASATIVQRRAAIDTMIQIAKS